MKQSKCELKIGCPTCISKEEREIRKTILDQKNYWNNAGLSPDVDTKYICDIQSDSFDKLLTFTGKTLEIGCGVGRLMKAGYYGIDISDKMLEIAKERKPNCYFTLNNGRTIPYEDCTFDNIYCVLVFQHLPIELIIGYITEVHRTIKIGGRFIFQFIDGIENEPFSKHHEFSKILELLRDRFKVVEVKLSHIHELWTWIICEKI